MTRATFAGRPDLLLGDADLLRHHGQVGGQCVGQIDPVIGLGDGHHQGVAGRQRD